MRITIISERHEDFQAIRQLNVAGFKTDAEANHVELLTKSPIPLISLVAEVNNTIAGHILFSPVSLVNNPMKKIAVAGLAPMAVLPEYQRQGIGFVLITEGLKQSEKAGYGAVVVLGHPQFYLKFGLVASITYDIKSEYDVPAEIFMVKELKKGVLAKCNGTIKYNEIFNRL